MSFNSIQLDWVCIRQPGSAVYVGMVVVVKELKSNINVLQSDNWAN